MLCHKNCTEGLPMLVRAQYGDYEDATFDPAMLAMEDLLPQRVIDQYQMTPQMWADRIKTWYSDHRGMPRWVRLNTCVVTKYRSVRLKPYCVARLIATTLFQRTHLLVTMVTVANFWATFLVTIRFF